MTQEETKELALKSINTLSSLPDAISKLASSLIDNQEQLSQLIQKESDTKNKLLLEVTNETDVNGKPLYSNDLKRQTAVNDRLEDDVEFKNITSKIKDLKLSNQKTNIHLERLRNEFSAAKYILRYLSDAN